MRGLQVVLYVAVLLCVTKNVIAACNVTGAYLPGSDMTTCICESGFSGADCQTAADGACLASTPSQVQADHFPVLDNTTAAYTQNTLRVNISGPYVTGRVYNGLHFVGSQSDLCNLGLNTASYWTSTVAGCRDVFMVNLPWNSHKQCGFNVSNALTSEDFLVFSATFSLDYTDNIGDIYSLALVRQTKVPYKIQISFPRKLEVTLEMVNVTAKVDVGVALTMDTFDPDTRMLTLEFTTIINWPNQLNTLWSADLPAGISLFGNFQEAPLSECTEVEGTVCKQVMTFTVVLDDLVNRCSYDGIYTLHRDLYTCRVDTECSHSPMSLQFNISTSDVCGKIEVAPHLTGTLKAFTTPAHVAPDTHEFNLGSTGYFLVTTDSGVGNDVYLEFYEVCFALNSAPAECLFVNGSMTTTNDTGNHFHYYEAKLNINNPGKSFSIYFSSVVFKVLPYLSNVYTFTAKAYATFEGNQNGKRSMEFSWDAVPKDQMASSVKIGMKDALPVGSTQIKESVGSTDSNIGFVIGGAAAGLVVIVFAVIGLALHNKKKNAAKAAAVSTASLVENRA